MRQIKPYFTITIDFWHHCARLLFGVLKIFPIYLLVLIHCGYCDIFIHNSSLIPKCFLIISAAFSATTKVVANVLPPVITGIILASTTLNLSIP